MKQQNMPVTIRIYLYFNMVTSSSTKYTISNNWLFITKLQTKLSLLKKLEPNFYSF